MLLRFIITTILFSISLTLKSLPPRNLIQHQQPLTLVVSIFNETDHLISTYKHDFLYSADEPQHEEQISFPINPQIGNYSVKAELFQQQSQVAVFSITKNLTRYAIIRKGSQNEAMMMQFGPSGQKIDENTAYGLHIPSKLSILVIYCTGIIPSESIGSFKSMFNFNMFKRNQQSLYVAPIDLSQLMIPYKTYRSVNSLPEGYYNMTLGIRVYPMTYYSLFFGFAHPELMRKVNPIMEQFYTDDMIDMIKEAMFTNNFYLVIAYFTLSFIQIFMNIFAFKNQIAVWKKVQEKGGLSIKALYQQLVCQVIVCLYLIDNDSNKLFLAFSALNMVLTIWKVMKAVEITTKQTFPYLSIGYKAWYHKKQQKIDSNAIHYTSYLTGTLFCIFLTYKAYSFYSSNAELTIPTLREFYSLSLNLSVGFIMVFGFVLMTPQLYINYKLKSVDHLPWKTLIYRFISTIIDDIFVFMIDIPTMQRMFSFRDDIIFILYLYQRWIYRVDPSRKAHFDQTDLTHYEQQSKSIKED